MQKHEQIRRLMEGAIDSHLHAYPCYTARRQDIFEVAQDARAFGMKGFVVKDFLTSTASWGYMVNKLIPEVEIYGGIVLGHSHGGINPKTVEDSFRMGGKVVWMPWSDSAWMIERMKDPHFGGSGTVYASLRITACSQGLSLFKDPLQPNEILDEVKEIISLAKQMNGVIETSHISPNEGAALVKEAKRQNFKKIVLTHANQTVTRYSPEQMKELAELGATIMLTYAQYLPKPGTTPPDIIELKNIIESIGCEHIVLATDMGRFENPPPVEVFRSMIANLLFMDVSGQTISAMIKDNPGRLYAE
jgi:hypothetical protein